MKKIMFALCFFFTVLTSIAVCTASIAHASPLEQIMSFNEVPKLGYSGLKNTYFNLNGDALQLNVNGVNRNSNHISGGYVRLMSKNGQKDYLSFPVKNCPFFSAYKFNINGGNEFLLLREGVSAVSDRACEGLWIIGKYKGNYISFISLDTLRNAGLIFADIAAETANGELRLIGITRDRNCRDGYYRGHRVRSYDLAYCAVNEARLFWDNNAQWFGIKLINY